MSYPTLCSSAIVNHYLSSGSRVFVASAAQRGFGHGSEGPRRGSGKLDDPAVAAIRAACYATRSRAKAVGASPRETVT